MNANAAQIKTNVYNKHNDEILVIGAGISGLVSAFFLQQQGFRVTLLEAATRVGGNIQSFKQHGALVERGPNSWINNRPAMARLVDELDLHGECVVANPLAKRRYIVQNGHLVALPDSIGSAVSNPILNPLAKLRVLVEPLFGRAVHEETIAEFVTRRLGSQCLDWLVDPFVSGVYAGDPGQLSVRAAVPKVYALEADYGSLLRGGMRLQWARRKIRSAALTGAMMSFRQGLQQLPESLNRRLGRVVHTDVQADSIGYTEATGWQVRSGERSWQAARLILAVPAHQIARLISGLHDVESGSISQVQASLRAIQYPAVASISMAFKRHQIAHPLDGFGALIPSREQRHTLGILFPSSVFDHRVAAGQCLLTGFIGGARNSAIMLWDTNRRQQQVLDDLTDLLDISGSPLWIEESFWPQAIPQYTLGHLQRVAQVDAGLATYPGLYLCSNWRDGVALGDCIENAWQLVQRVMDEYD